MCKKNTALEKVSCSEEGRSSKTQFWGRFICCNSKTDKFEKNLAEAMAKSRAAKANVCRNLAVAVR